MINTNFPGLFDSHMTSTKDGVMLILKNQDPLKILHSQLVVKRQEKMTNKDGEQNTCNDKDFFDTLFTIGKKLNKDHWWKQYVDNATKYTQDHSQLDCINFDDLQKDIDPVIWNFLILLTMGQTELSKLSNFNWTTHYDLKKKGTVYDHKKFSKLLFLCHTLLYNMHNNCGYPLHVALAEMISTYSQSDELMDCLSKFGISVCKTTHRRFVQSIINEIKNNGRPGSKSVN